MTEAAAAAFVPGLGFTRNDFLWMLIAGVVFFGIFTLVSGPLAEKYGRRKMLLAVTGGIFVFGLLFVPLFSGGFVGTMALLIIGFSLMGLTFGPMGALLPELFPTNVRYTGSAVSYNVSSILGAAVAPFIAVALWEQADGSPVAGRYLPDRHGGPDPGGAVPEQGNPGPGLREQRSLTRPSPFTTMPGTPSRGAGHLLYPAATARSAPRSCRRIFIGSVAVNCRAFSIRISADSGGK